MTMTHIHPEQASPTRVKIVRLFRAAAVSVLVRSVCWAGIGTFSPPDGNYGFYPKGTPPHPAPPTESGSFATSGSVKTMSTGNYGNFKQNGSGLYENTSEDRPLSNYSVCFYNSQSGNAPFKYEFKIGGDVVSEGDLVE